MKWDSLLLERDLLLLEREGSAQVITVSLQETVMSDQRADEGIPVSIIPVVTYRLPQNREAG